MQKRYQVFVSSTYTDLIEERKEVTQAILKCNCFPAGMELFPASNEKQWTIIKRVIDDSDFYLLIIAGRYGSLGVNEYGKKVSYTEMEFDYALSVGKPIIVMLHQNPESLPSKFTEKSNTNIQRLNKFREKAATGRMVSFWNNKDQLHSSVLESLHIAKDTAVEAIGWVRANSVVPKNENIEPSVLQTIEEFKKIPQYEKRIEYLKKLTYFKRKELFEKEEFIDAFTEVIDVKTTMDVVCEAINLIPDNYELKTEIRNLMKLKIDLLQMFVQQYSNFTAEKNDFVASVIKLLYKLELYEKEYSSAVFNILKSNYSILTLRRACIAYFEYYNSSSLRKGLYNDLINYIIPQINNTNRTFVISDLIKLLVSTCCDEDDFIIIHKVFLESDQEVQEQILNCIFKYCGSEVLFLSPKIQRKFFEICDIVYSWGKDEISEELLRYCLFTRTFDIFTVDEIYEKLKDFNDDVFYMFIRGVSLEEFGSDFEEYYELDADERNRVIDVINDRNHPRGKKLIELFSDE